MGEIRSVEYDRKKDKKLIIVRTEDIKKKTTKRQNKTATVRRKEKRERERESF